MKNRYVLTKSYLFALKLVVQDKALIMMLIVAPIMYGFYYPWPYSTQMVQNTKVGIINQDGSRLSREIIRLASAHSNLLLEHYTDTKEAHEAMLNEKIAGYMVIPKKLTHNMFLQQPNHIPITANGAYLLLGKSGITGLLNAVGTVSAGVEIKQLMAQGATFELAKNLREPVPLIIDNRYNPNEGYGNYIVPAVAWLILQQSLLIAAALFIGTLSEKKQVLTSPLGWVGRVAALSSINMIMVVFYTGWVFINQGYAHGGNPLGNLLLMFLFSPTVASLGCLLGLWFKVRERALQIITFSSLPLFFLSGYSWPLEALPEALKIIRWLTPSTATIQAGVGFNQMGVSIADNAPYLMALALLGIAAFSALLYFGSNKKPQ